MRLQYLLCCCCLFMLAGCRGKAPPLVPNAEIERLIEQLASTNPPPEFDYPGNHSSMVKTAESYDAERQKVVHDAYFRLEALGAKAFPYLMANIDDKRYCRTMSSATYGNVSVGATCGELVVSVVDVGSIIGPDPKSDVCSYFENKWNGDLKRWWNAYHDKSLVKMQIDCLEFEIKKAKELGLDSRKAQSRLQMIRDSGKTWQEIDPELENRGKWIRVIDILLFEKFPKYQ